MSQARDEAHDDARKAVEAENSLRHQQDLSRYIDSKAVAVSRQMEPWRERRRANHFMQEYEELMNKGNRR